MQIIKEITISGGKEMILFPSGKFIISNEELYLETPLSKVHLRVYYNNTQHAAEPSGHLIST